MALDPNLLALAGIELLMGLCDFYFTRLASVLFRGCVLVFRSLLLIYLQERVDAAINQSLIGCNCDV